MRVFKKIIVYLYDMFNLISALNECYIIYFLYMIFVFLGLPNGATQ